MDPYLEGIRWPGFHHDLATEIKRQLVPKLRPKYYADTATYFLLDSEDDVAIGENLYPDVDVFDRGGGGFPGTQLGTGTATAPVRLQLALPHPMPHSRVEIRDLANRKLVTGIEFLSPTNKKGAGRKQYLRKRKRLLKSSAHLIEIDLLRRGRRLPLRGDVPHAVYFILLSRAEERPDVEVWPLALLDTLPTIPVPLLHGDADVTLDLQQAVTSVYDLSAYDDLIRYQDPPDVPFTPSEAVWAAPCLQSWRKQSPS
jgi:hypothetical protein